MVNRPAGGARSKRHPREPHDWYCEDARPVDQLLDDLTKIPALDLDPARVLIYDPSCGRGNILDVAKRRGFATVGSDLFDRICPIQGTRPSERHDFFRADFLRLDRPPATRGRRLVIMNNPPYSYEADIAERFIRRALALPIGLACFVVPIAFMCSNDRWAFFRREFRPSHVGVLSERPSMPPGSTLDPYTEFKGGMGDYVWLIYRPPHRWRTETIWLRPSTI